MVGPLVLLKMLHCRKKYQEPTSIKKRKPRSDKFCKYPETTCRICLKETNKDIPIFGNLYTDGIPQALSTFVGIEIEEKDSYPKYLCQYCHDLLQGAILLRKTAQKSDQLLKKSFAYVSRPPMVSEDDFGDFGLDDNLPHSTSHSQWLEAQSFFCSRCDLDFASLKEYCEHRLSEDHENRRVTCPICKKSYATAYYKKHKTIHQPDCPYMCDICGKKFAANGTFSRHRLTHFTKLPFKCPLCPYRGRFKDYLKLHMRSHSGEKPYQCSECAARFVSKSNLNKHTVTHRADRDFNCDSCGKGFYTKKKLEVHIKVQHMGIRDQICDICSKAFGTRKQMMKHKLKVHKRQKLKSGRMPLYLQLEKMGENNDYSLEQPLNDCET